MQEDHKFNVVIYGIKEYTKGTPYSPAAVRHYLAVESKAGFLVDYAC